MAAVGAALKRILLTLATSKKGRKILLYIVLVVLFLLFFPILAVVAVLNSDVSYDRTQLVQLVSQNLSAEDRAKLQQINDTGIAIDNAMNEAGFNTRAKEAEVLFLLALSDHMGEEDFVSRLVGCFAEGQTDEQLIAAVNAEFGKELLAEDFTHIMQGIRAVYIDTSYYTDPYTKNNLDLVQYAIEAERRGWGYVWGTYGLVLTEARFNAKLEQYPDDISEHEDFIRENWIGKRTADCVGFIKGYCWLNPNTHEISYGTNDCPDVGADGMYNAAEEKGSIDTIPEIPGLAVWKEGHIGIYIGNGETIEAMGTRYGVVRRNLSDGTWTDWLKIPYITYVEETEEPSPTDTTDTTETTEPQTETEEP